MGFPSPAADYVEGRVSPDQVCRWGNNPALFMARAISTSWREGIKQGAVLVIDRSRTAVDGSLVVTMDTGEFEVKRLKLFPTACLESLDNADDIRLIEGGDLEGEETMVWGVVTYIINDATTGEFDDCPVM
ncbi:S24 family peptidase [Rouxiella sp. WC2420]|uniref:S24 family peptidase n=1 Tax=Rouxiella sp. WC2420 TaxID=3234145 RepID=A0AB39VLZ6_9GAMM